MSSTSRSTDPQQLRAIADAAAEAHEAGDVPLALERYDDVLSAGDGAAADDPVVRESLVAARFGIATIRLELGDLEAAERGYAAVVDLLERVGDADTAHEVAMAQLNRAIALELLDRPDEALDEYDRAADHRDAPDPAAREPAIRAAVNRAVLLARLGRDDEALGAAQVVAATLEGDVAIWAREQAAMTLRLQAQLLATRGEVAPAALALERAAERTVGVDDPGAEEQLAAARAERAALEDRLRSA